MSVMIFVVLLQMWQLSLFGQQSQAALYSSAEESKVQSPMSAMLYP
jgi:hypothetical protein